MNHLQIIETVKENAAEWLEMSSNPDEIIIGILAKQIVKLQVQNEILEARLQSKHASRWE